MAFGFEDIQRAARNQPRRRKPSKKPPTRPSTAAAIRSISRSTRTTGASVKRSAKPKRPKARRGVAHTPGRGIYRQPRGAKQLADWHRTLIALRRIQSGTASPASQLRQTAAGLRKAPPDPYLRDLYLQETLPHLSRPTPEAENLEAEQLQQGFVPPQGGFLGVLKGGGINFGRDVLDTVTGLPAMAELGVRASTYPLQDRETKAGTRAALSGAASGFADDISYRWGPWWRAGQQNLISGDLGGAKENLELGVQRHYEHPGLFLMDVGGAWSAAGAGVRVGVGGAAKVTRSPRLEAVASRSVDPAKNTNRPRPRKVRKSTLGQREVNEAIRDAEQLSPVRSPYPLGRRIESSIEVPQRPFSANPVTRGLIQRPANRARSNVLEPFTDRLANRYGALQGAIGAEARFNRAGGRTGRRLEYDFEDAVARSTNEVVGGLRRHKPVVEAAAWAHAKGLLGEGTGKTGPEARAALATFLREGVESDLAHAADGGKPRPRTTRRQKQIKRIEKIPDELTDLETAPEWFREYVDQYKTAARENTRRQVEAGVLDETTAAEAPPRFAQLVHGDGAGVGAVHIKDFLADKNNVDLNPATAGGRMTGQPLHEWKGRAAQSGNVVADADALIATVREGQARVHHRQHVAKLVDQSAFRGPDGRVATGNRDAMKAAADRGEVVLVTRKTLAESLDNDSGLALQGDEVAGKFDADANNLRAALDDPNANLSDVVALPKGVVDAIKAVSKRPFSETKILGQSLADWIDRPLNAWRRGILAYAPRWYVNNMFGNTLMYGILTGGDIRAIVQARGEGRRFLVGPHREASAARPAVPEQVAGAGVTRSEGGRGVPGSQPLRDNRVSRTTNTLMDVNFRLEDRLRAAAHIAVSKKRIRDEGGRFRKMTDDEVAEAITTAPDKVKEQIIREVLMGMGDYARLTPFERNIMRRVFPFYSWMRVIGILTASMPFRWPKRTWVIQNVSRMAADELNPTDDLVDTHNRGMVSAFGAHFPTRAANPFFTHTNLLTNAAEGNFGAILGDTSRDLNPLIQAPLQYGFGVDAFGRQYSAPSDYDGSVQLFGGRQRINPSTGQPERYTPRPSVFDVGLSVLPHTNVGRQALAGDNVPYGVTSTIDLLNHRLFGKGDPEEMFIPKSDGYPWRPVGGPLAGTASVMTGIRPQYQDEEKIRKRHRERIQRILDAQG